MTRSGTYFSKAPWISYFSSFTWLRINETVELNRSNSNFQASCQLAHDRRTKVPLMCVPGVRRCQATVVPIDSFRVPESVVSPCPDKKNKPCGHRGLPGFG
jgi:hypothetical protein